MSMASVQCTERRLLLLLGFCLGQFLPFPQERTTYQLDKACKAAFM